MMNPLLTHGGTIACVTNIYVGVHGEEQYCTFPADANPGFADLKMEVLRLRR
jgi:hypothetical protein